MTARDKKRAMRAYTYMYAYKYVHTCVHINVQSRLLAYVSISKISRTRMTWQLAMRALPFEYVEINTLLCVYIYVQAGGL